MKETTEITIGEILIIHTGWFRVVDITVPRHPALAQSEVVFWCRVYRRSEDLWAEKAQPMHAEFGQKWAVLPADVARKTFPELIEQK